MGDRLRQRVERELEKLGTLEGRRSRFSEEWSYRCDGREIVHFHGDRELDVRLTRRVIRAERETLASDERIVLSPRDGDWVIVRVARAADVPLVVELVRRAIGANRRRG